MKLNCLISVLLVAALLAGCSKQHSIEGIWIQPIDDKGGFVYEVFRDDGTCLSGTYVPPTDDSGGFEAQAEVTYRVKGQFVGLSGGNEITKHFNLEGEVESHESYLFDAYDIKLIWESDDIVIMVIGGDEFKYTRVHELPSELRF